MMIIHVGDLVFFKILGKPILFLNSYQAMSDLLDKRSGVYGHKPNSVMINDLYVSYRRFCYTDAYVIIMKIRLGVARCSHALWGALEKASSTTPSLLRTERR